MVDITKKMFNNIHLIIIYSKDYLDGEEWSTYPTDLPTSPRPHPKSFFASRGEHEVSQSRITNEHEGESHDQADHDNK
jgi:hypothetical protein